MEDFPFGALNKAGPAVFASMGLWLVSLTIAGIVGAPTEGIDKRIVLLALAGREP